MALLEDAASWLRDQCQEALSVQLIWSPRNGKPRIINAVVGSTLFTNEYGNELNVITQSRDFIVDARELPEEPMRGDKIIWRNVCYQVLAPRNEPVWRWSDYYHKVKRIHTREVENTDEEEDDDG